MDSFSLAAVGDIMLGDHPVCFGHGVRSTIRKGGHQRMVEQIVPHLLGRDVVVGNLECVLSDVGHDERNLRSSELRGDPSAVALLQQCGFNAVSIANNHILQHGSEAFDDTVRSLSMSDIQAVGIKEKSSSNVVVFRKGALKVKLVAASLRPEQYFRDKNTHYFQGPPDRLIEQIEELKQSAPNDPIVLSLHWGDEYLHVPSASQIELAHKLADAGATLILGHHPHVMQGIEHYRSSVIAYSLGNFLFDSWQTPTKESFVLQCDISTAGVTNLTTVPFYIDSELRLRTDDQLRNREIVDKLSSYSAQLADESRARHTSQEEYEQVAARVYNQYRYECYRYFAKNLFRYDPVIVGSSVTRALLRRVGLG